MSEPMSEARLEWHKRLLGIHGHLPIIAARELIAEVERLREEVSDLRAHLRLPELRAHGE